MTESRQTIHAHVGLRGVAAFGVIGVHLPDPHVIFGSRDSAIFPRGYVLVDLFFLLSGFIMAYSYLAAFKTQPLPLFYRNFMAARFARIYPLHVFALALLGCLAVATAFATAHFGNPQPFANPIDLQFFKQLALLNTWSSGTALYWNFPSWSISAEMQIYLIFPLLASIFLLPSPVRWLLGSIVPALFYVLVGSMGGSLDLIDWRAVPRCAAGFLLGMLIFDLHRVPKLWQSTVMEIAAIAGLVLTISLASPDVLAIPCFAALVYSTVNSQTMISRGLSSSIGQWLGDRSYSIYLLHIPVLTLVKDIYYRVSPAPESFNWIMVMDTVSILIILLVADRSYRWIEIPSRRLVRSWLSSPPSNSRRALPLNQLDQA